MGGDDIRSERINDFKEIPDILQFRVIQFLFGIPRDIINFMKFHILAFIFDRTVKPDTKLLYSILSCIKTGCLQVEYHPEATVIIIIAFEEAFSCRNQILLLRGHDKILP